MTENAYASWRSALAGGRPGIHEDEPWCGYFKMRDRRGLNIQKAPIKRPFIPCAIWPENGELKASLAKSEASVERIWPYCAKHPITYEEYAFWCQHERWPETEKTS